MVRKSLSTVPKPFNAEKYLKRMGLGRQRYPLVKAAGKLFLKTVAACSAIWWYNETSPLGWFNLTPRPKEEREDPNYYERIPWPYPGDTEAMEEFIAKGGAMGKVMGPKGLVETDFGTPNYQKVLQDKKMENEATKLWLRMRNEVITELQEKGYHVE